MRGRKPRPVSIAPADRPVLEQVARSNSLPWYQVRRARIVLANSRGVHNSTVANATKLRNNPCRLNKL